MAKFDKELQSQVANTKLNSLKETCTTIKAPSGEPDVKYGEAGHHQVVGYMAMVVTKGNNSTNS